MATAVASPTRIAPSSQTMEASSLSPPRPPPSDASVTSSPDRVRRSLSLSRSGDLQSSVLLRSEEYRQLFRLPSEEVLVQDFNCALQENFLLQGHMYLFDHYLCFYSNIFGFETKKIIPFQDVTAVRRAKTAGIFPNAIEIVAGGKKHFFASFLSRDEAFKLIFDGWSQHGDGLKGSLDQQDFKSETSSLLNGVNLETANGSDSPMSDLDSEERNLQIPISEDINVRVDDSATFSPEQVADVEAGQVALLDTGPSTSASVKWIQEPRDAPEIPQCYAKVAESKFPISAEQFFSLFFSDDAIGFLKSFHNKCGDKDLKCTSWLPLDKIGYTREKTFQHPIKVYFGAKCGSCKETQKFRVYKSSHLVIETSQEVSDVPYADYFTVEGLWDVQKDGGSEECCILQVYVNVAFSKKTIWKGKIEQSTMEECREAYATWIHLAHELLKQKNIEKPEEANIVQDGQVNQEKTGQLGGHSEGSRQNAEPRSPDDDEMTRHPFVGDVSHATTIMSTLRSVAVKFSSSFRSQGNLQLFLVIAFSAILLLMQFSIVVLLSRPQQVHVIPQTDPSVGLGISQRASEAVHWIEKRMHLLKDELLLVETQLERMRHEHSLLKAQLKDLDRFYKQPR